MAERDFTSATAEEKERENVSDNWRREFPSASSSGLFEGGRILIVIHLFSERCKYLNKLIALLYRENMFRGSHPSWAISVCSFDDSISTTYNHCPCVVVRGRVLNKDKF